MYACTLLELWTDYDRIWSFSKICNYGNIWTKHLYFYILLGMFYKMSMFLCYFLVTFSVFTWKLWQYVSCYICWHAASSDGVARLWNVETGAVEREYNGHQKAVTSLAFRDEIIRDWSCVCGHVLHGMNFRTQYTFVMYGDESEGIVLKQYIIVWIYAAALIFPHNHPYFTSPWSTQLEVSVCTITSIANLTKF